MPRLLEVKALPGHRIAVRYDDDVEGMVDLSELAGRGVFAAWDQPHAFERVEVGEQGQVRWSEEVEVCGDAVYLQLTGKTPEDIMPGLRASAVDA